LQDSHAASANNYGNRTATVTPSQTGHDLLPKTIRRRAGWLNFRLLTLLSILGPGFITANVDNDPGGILTYSQAGAKYG
jgi:Mn2+/Fe2+ NRAMP family transporter